MQMIFLRSLVFNVAFYLNLAGLLLLGIACAAYGQRGIIWLARTWGRTSLWLAKKICNLDVEYRGLENILQGGYLIAPKHQSIWETFALLPLFSDFTFIVKRELTWIPFFGWYILVARQISVNRSKGRAALIQTTALAKVAIEEKRQIFIFPEGTRRAAGAPPNYRYGVAAIYQSSGAPCLPIALNSGLFWPRRSFIRQPGKILVQILKPIPPNMPADAFFNSLIEQLEAATNALIAESILANPALSKNFAGNVTDK